MKYFLVEVKKEFGIYPLKAQMVMRGKLAKGLYADNVKIIKELKPDEIEKEYSTNVKYRIEKTEDAETDETDETQTAGDAGTNETPENDVTPTEEVKTTPEAQNGTENVETTETAPENTENLDDVLAGAGAQDANAGTLQTESGDEVAYEDMPTEKLLEIANDTYKLNKPVNTGRENLLNSLNAIKNA